MSDLQTIEAEAHALIRGIQSGLSPIQGMLRGQRMLERWHELEGEVCAAKLAIIRDEFAVRFPGLSRETLGCTFGITDPSADRYLVLLRPTKKDDIFNVACEVVERVYGVAGARRIPGVATFASDLTQSLQDYSRRVEAKLTDLASRRTA